MRPAAAGAAPVPTAQRADVVRRGRAVAVSRDGRHVVVAHAARASLVLHDRRTQGRREVALGGHPLELALAPDDALVAVTTAFWQGPGLELVALRDGTRRARVDAGPAPFAAAFTPDARHVVVSGGEDDGALRILRAPALTAGRTVPLGRVPRGVAVAGGVAWVALHGEDALLAVDLRGARVVRRLPVPPMPERLAASRSGRRLLVSHGGHEAHAISEVDTRTGRVRRRPIGGRAGAVAWGPRGTRLAVLPDDDAIAVLDARGRRRLRPTVSGPRGLAVAGRHVFTTSAADAAIGRVTA